MKDELGRQNPTRVRQIYYGNISYWYNPLKTAQVFSTVEIIHVPPVKMDIPNERAGLNYLVAKFSGLRFIILGFVALRLNFATF